MKLAWSVACIRAQEVNIMLSFENLFVIDHLGELDLDEKEVDIEINLREIGCEN
jgi:hypothetical protein